MTKLPTFFLLMLVAGVPATAQVSQTPEDPLENGFVGVGYISASFGTSWYYYRILDPYANDVEYNYPYHLFSRSAIGFAYGTSRMFRIGPVNSTLQFELDLGLSGDTEEDWLPRAELISDGGETYAGSVLAYFSYPLNLIENTPISILAGTGLQFTVLVSNGKNVGSIYANDPAYRYGNGWTEMIVGTPIVLGASAKFGNVIGRIEYRSLLGGTGGTDWSPVGNEIEEEDGPEADSFVILIGIAL